MSYKVSILVEKEFEHPTSSICWSQRTKYWVEASIKIFHYIGASSKKIQRWTWRLYQDFLYEAMCTKRL